MHLDDKEYIHRITISDPYVNHCFRESSMQIAPFIGIHKLDMLLFSIHLPVNDIQDKKTVVRRRIMTLLTDLVLLNKKDH